MPIRHDTSSMKTYAVVQGSLATTACSRSTNGIASANSEPKKYTLRHSRPSRTYIEKPDHLRPDRSVPVRNPRPVASNTIYLGLDDCIIRIFPCPAYLLASSRAFSLFQRPCAARPSACTDYSSACPQVCLRPLKCRCLQAL